MESLSPKTYSTRTVWIHWATALLILIIIASGLYMQTLEATQQKLDFYKLHFACGSMVLVLTIVRIVALISDKRPTSLYPKGTAHHKLINVVHYGFYGVILLMCLTGIVSLYTESILPAVQQNLANKLPNMHDGSMGKFMITHHLTAKIVFLLLILHISGSIIHFARFKENPLKRIWFN